MWFSVALVKFQPRSQGLSSDFGLVEVFFTNLNAEIVACILLFRKSSHKPNLESSIKYGDLGAKKQRRSKHARASYLGLSFRPPGFSPYIRGRKKGKFRDWI